MSNNIPTFPWFKLSVIGCTIFASSLSLSGLFPYVGFMVMDMVHVGPDQAGYYAGYVASSGMFGRMVSSVYWGRVADRIGRKPVLLLGLTAVVITSLAFGLSVNLWMALITRFLLGFFNPIISVAKTLVSEVCPVEHESTGMGTVTSAWALGLIFGPAIGGLLAKPAETMPHIFGAPFFHQFPYFLPNLVTAIFSLFTIVVVFFFFEETLVLQKVSEKSTLAKSPDFSTQTKSSVLSPFAPKQKYSKLNGEDDGEDCDDNDAEAPGDGVALDVSDASISSYSDIVSTDSSTSLIGNGEGEQGNGEGIEMVEGGGGKHYGGNVDGIKDVVVKPTDTDEGGASIYALLSIKGVPTVIGSYVLISIISIIFDEVLPLWALSTIPNGGLEFQSSQIGMVMTITGFSLVIYTATVYPKIANYLGQEKSFTTGVLIMSPLCISITLIPLLVGYASNDVVFALLATNVVAIKMCTNLGFASVALLINRSVPTGKRASVNGLSMTFGSCSKAVGPMVGSVILAWSIGPGRRSIGFPCDYHLVFFLIAISAFVVSFMKFEKPAELVPLESKQDTAESGEKNDIAEDKCLTDNEDFSV